jgi:hypothetical protein
MGPKQMFVICKLPHNISGWYIKWLLSLNTRTSHVRHVGIIGDRKLQSTEVAVTDVMVCHQVWNLLGGGVAGGQTDLWLWCYHKNVSPYKVKKADYKVIIKWRSEYCRSQWPDCLRRIAWTTGSWLRIPTNNDNFSSSSCAVLRRADY